MRRPLILFLWLATDYALFLAAYAFAYFFRVGWIFSSDLPFHDYMTAVAISGIPWLAFLATTRTFGLTRNQRSPRNAAYIAYASVLGIAFVTLVYFFLFQGIFSRMLVIEAAVLSAVTTWTWHMAMGFIMRAVLISGHPVYPTLIVGVTRETRTLLKHLRERRSVLVPVAILDASGVKEKEIEGVPVKGKLDKLEETLRDFGITHVLQCSDLEQSINLLGACRAHGITYMLLPSVLGIVEQDERVESLEGKAVTVVSPDAGWWSWFFR
ncbi:MAG: hypothetical protein HOO67_07150 [Candidatus Peribacteraceae bacterium]|nr:hypothetical protein [Candidatus Peribacteraceae bacterium]